MLHLQPMRMPPRSVRMGITDMLRMLVRHLGTMVRHGSMAGCLLVLDRGLGVDMAIMAVATVMVIAAFTVMAADMDTVTDITAADITGADTVMATMAAAGNS
jgi:hypothetical protein